MIWFFRLLIGYYRYFDGWEPVYVLLRIPNEYRRAFPAVYTKVPYPLLLFDCTGAAGFAAYQSDGFSGCAGFGLSSLPQGQG